MTAYFLIQPSKISKKLLILLCLSAVVTSVALFLSEYSFEIVRRFEQLENFEEALRFLRIQMAFKLLKNIDIWFAGLGPDGFNYLTGLNYPHNFILELLVEYGFMGLISLIMLLGFGMYYSYFLVRSDAAYVFKFIAAVFVYLVLCAQTSGNIVTARHMFFSAIILANAYAGQQARHGIKGTERTDEDSMGCST